MNSPWAVNNSCLKLFLGNDTNLSSRIRSYKERRRQAWDACARAGFEKRNDVNFYRRKKCCTGNGTEKHWRPRIQHPGLWNLVIQKLIFVNKRMRVQSLQSSNVYLLYYSASRPRYFRLVTFKWYWNHWFSKQMYHCLHFNHSTFKHV